MRKYTLEAFLVAFALLISTGVVSTANAQMPGMEEVSGHYVDQEAGLEITFPEGWTGFAFGDESGKFVTVAPEGMTGGEEVAQTIALTAANKEDVEDPSDPSEFTGELSPECTTPSFNQRTVSGVAGWEGVVQCTDDEGKTIKMKMVAAETATRWIMVLYWATLAEFDSGVGAFDASVNTLNVQGAVNTSMPSGGTGTEDGTEPSVMSVMVAGGTVDVQVESVSQITEFELDEATKTLSFKADGIGTATTISIGKVLEGPYTVMVDGTASQDFEVDEEGGVQTMSVSHNSGAHEITVTGTQVVPEFPIAVVGVMAALVGIAAVIGRTRLIRRSS
jgi:hypothetical protein